MGVDNRMLLLAVMNGGGVGVYHERERYSSMAVIHVPVCMCTDCNQGDSR